MSGYRPITDVWILGRSKTKDEKGEGYYGAYLSGFLERARPLLVGGDKGACVLHVCGGMAKNYNGVHGGITLSGYGKNDLTLDIDPKCRPDILADARDLGGASVVRDRLYVPYASSVRGYRKPDAILIDRPYSLEDAKHYRCGPDVLPNLNKLLSDCLRLTSGHVGVIDYVWPTARDAKEVCAVAVGTGRNSRARWFTVWKKNRPRKI